MSLWNSDKGLSADNITADERTKLETLVNVSARNSVQSYGGGLEVISPAVNDTIKINATVEDPFVVAIADGFGETGTVDKIVTITEDTEYKVINDGEVPLTDAGLEVLPESTNLIPWSEDFSSWTKTHAEILATGSESYDGTFTATSLKLVAETAQFSKSSSYYGPFSVAFYAKGVAGESLRIQILDEGDWSSYGGYDHTFSGQWERVVFEGLDTSSGSGNSRIYLMNNQTYDIYMVMSAAQFEDKSFVTPYIKTEGSPVTRPATPTTKIDITDKITEELGYELLPNTEFANTTNITTNNAIPTVSGGELTVTSTGSDSRAVEEITTVVGEVYELTIEGYGGSDIGTVDIVAGSNLDSAVAPISFLTSTFATGSFTEFTGRFVATESSMKVFMGADGDFAKFKVPTVKKVTTNIDRNPIRAALGGKIVETELLPNTSFGTLNDIEGNNTSLSVYGGYLTVPDNGVYSSGNMTILTEVGKRYRVSFESFSGNPTIGNGAGRLYKDTRKNTIGDYPIIERAASSGWQALVGEFVAETETTVFSMGSESSYTANFRNPSIKEVQPIRTEITVKDWVPGGGDDTSYFNILNCGVGSKAGPIYQGSGLIKTFDRMSVVSSVELDLYNINEPITITVIAGKGTDMREPISSEEAYYQILYTIAGVTKTSVPMPYSGRYIVDDFLLIPYGAPEIPMTYGSIQIKDLETGEFALDVDFTEPARDNYMLEASDIADGSYYVNMDTEGIVRLDTTGPKYGRNYVAGSGDYYDEDKGYFINENGVKDPKVYFANIVVAAGVISQISKAYQYERTEDGTFAEIHLHDGNTPQSIPTGAAYTKITGFDNNGESSNCTSDQANSKITINRQGRYLVSHSWSGESDTSNTIFWGTVFLDGVEQSQLHWKRKFGIAGDVGSCSATGIINVTSSPQDLDLRVRHDDAGSENLTSEYVNLNVVYLGGN